MSAYLGTEIKRNTTNTAVRFREIPVCGYHLSMAEEKRIYTTRDFLRIYRDMALIREFETMLLALKTNGNYHGIPYSLKPSVALDLGREALSVGEAYCAAPCDDMFSSDKNISDLIAKGLSAIEKMTEAELTDIMRGYHDGAVLSPLAEVADKRANVKDVALDFLLYGLLSDIFNKITGFCYGSCGSKNMYFIPFGSYPCNMTSADSAGLAVGAALYHKNCGSNGCVIANMNAGAASDGQTWEALCLSCSGVFRTKKSVGLPVLFVLSRGRDAEESENAIRRCTARICAGLGSDMMYAETVNASDPLAVIDAVSRKKEILKRGEGPALLEMVCDHLQENPKGVDPLKLYREKLIRGGVISGNELKALEEHIVDRMEKIFRLAADHEKSPLADTMHPESAVFAREDGAKRAYRKIMPEVKIPKSSCKSLQEIQGKCRIFSENEKCYQIRDAVFEPVLDMLYRNPDFTVFSTSGKDEVFGGVSEAVESKRFICVPASKKALVSCALGYSLRGGKSLVSLDGAEALSTVADVLIHQIAEWRLRTVGEISLPLVLYIPMKNGNRVQRAESCLSALSSVSGLKVVYPVTPYDAKGMMTAALEEETPVVFLESENLYDVGEYFRAKGVPEEAYILTIGKTSLKKEGKDLTVLAVGASLYPAVRAAEILSETYGVEAEVLNARTIVPLDDTHILRSVEKTGKLLIVGEGSARGSVMRDFAAELGESAFDFLDAPVVVLGANDGTANGPTETEIIRAIDRKIIPLDENMK